MRLFLISLLVMLAIFASPTATASTNKTFACTITTRIDADYAYGIIFGSKSHQRLVIGCNAFAQESPTFKLRFGYHQPPLWIIVARYGNANLHMVAFLIAPYSISELIFKQTNRPVFIRNGWTLLRKG